MSDKQTFDDFIEAMQVLCPITPSEQALASCAWFNRQGVIFNQELEIINLKAELAVLKKQLERSQQLNTQQTELQNV